MRKVTKLQQQIINQLLRDPSATVCARVVGCNYNYVRQCLVKPHIILALNESSERVVGIAEKEMACAEVDAAWVLTQAVKVYDRCMVVDPVLDKDGNETGEFRFEHAGANKALEIIAKHRAIAAFEPERLLVNTSSDVKWEIEIVHTSVEEYRQRIREEAEKPPIEHQR